MSINENTRTTLHEMGLNAYEIDAYVTLLEGGEMTAMEISEKAQVPYSKIYEVLNSLKEKGWIKSGESRPTKYYPVPPIEATRFTKLRLEDKYVGWENIVAENLQPLYEQKEIVERPEMLILRGQQAVLAKLEEMLKMASKEIVVAAPEFAKPIIALADPLFNSLKKNVNIQFMAAGKREDWVSLKKYTGINEVRLRDHMFGGGIIVDGKEAMLFLGDDKPNLVIWSAHVGVVGFAREYFQFLWNSSGTI
ncbi:MAG: TrmB family transcriptional regulator [Candidatus Bathyarchaeia archaeon]|jgi:sugar-specific transcriptional regulator TrmB